MAWTRDEIAAQAAKGLRDGYDVNLGLGIPTLVANFVLPSVSVTLQTNGLNPCPRNRRIITYRREVADHRCAGLGGSQMPFFPPREEHVA